MNSVSIIGLLAIICIVVKIVRCLRLKKKLPVCHEGIKRTDINNVNDVRFADIIDPKTGFMDDMAYQKILATAVPMISKDKITKTFLKHTDKWRKEDLIPVYCSRCKTQIVLNSREPHELSESFERNGQWFMEVAESACQTCWGKTHKRQWSKG